MKNRNFSFYLIIISVFIIIVGPELFSNGMFMDGLWYAVISKNMANGFGSFWDPHFSETIFFHFREHPPLAFGLQSILFKIFGDGFLTERIYSLSTYFITGWIIVLIWRRIPECKFKSFGWLPLLFWSITPVIFWSAKNNMLENTMMIFTSLSVLFILKSFSSNKISFLLLSGLMLFLGFLTKGFVAFFPLSMPFWLFIFKHNYKIKQAIVDTSIMLFGTFFPFLIIFLFSPEGITMLLQYINKQVIGSITNIQTVNNRFFIIFRFIQELSPSFIIIAIIIVSTRKYRNIKLNNRWIYLFAFLGLSGIMPIMISMKQSGFYILPAYPFLSIALAMTVAERVSSLTGRITDRGFKVLRLIGFVLFITGIGLAVLNTGKIGRDKEKISDIYKIINSVEKDSVISIEPQLYSDWSLHGYFQRYAGISLDYTNYKQHRYLLVNKGHFENFMAKYIKIPIGSNLYDLYKNPEYK